MMLPILYIVEDNSDSAWGEQRPSYTARRTRGIQSHILQRSFLTCDLFPRGAYARQKANQDR